MKTRLAARTVPFSLRVKHIVRSWSECWTRRTTDACHSQRNSSYLLPLLPLLYRHVSLLSDLHAALLSWSTTSPGTPPLPCFVPHHCLFLLFLLPPPARRPLAAIHGQNQCVACARRSSLYPDVTPTCDHGSTRVARGRVLA